MGGPEARGYLTLVYILESLWQQRESSTEKVRNEAGRPIRRPLPWSKEQTTKGLAWSSGIQRTRKEQA